MEAELETINAQISEKEEQLEALLPEWDVHRATEAEERMRLDEVQAHLDMLYEKQGRLSRFRTRQERDQFLTGELQSLRAFRERQGSALESAKRELENARDALAKLSERSEGVQNRLEDRREQVKALTEELAGVTEKHSKLIKKRKELWREDARLTSTVGHAENELQQHERDLASMMDKVRAVLIPVFDLTEPSEFRILAQACEP